jgi:3-oxoacyl-[acyl-carrier-protein] synthase-3
MDGPELVKFSLDIAPPLIDSVLARAQWTRDQIDMYLIHQATLFMLDHLRERLSLDREHTPEALENYGNTVSSTIPILIRDLRESGRLRPGKQTLLMGFGVGLSWAGCVWTETWAAQQVQVETIAEKSAEKPIEPPGDPPSDTQRRSDNASADSREAA